MMDLNTDRAKITPAHLARQAFVYVRQSSPQQVRRNQESQRRQYDFAAQALTLGWRRERVIVLDGDQGTIHTPAPTSASWRAPWRVPRRAS